MVYFKDLEEHGRSYLCIVGDPSTNAIDAKHKFLVYPSMMRTNRPDPNLLRRELPPEMTAYSDVELENGPTYVLKSSMANQERETGDDRPPMLGRWIIRDTVRWGPNLLKIPGECTYIPRYWEWTEDVLARCSSRLQNAQLYDAVYASLFSYDRDPNVMRAFCESWCPQTNTLHTVEGEWSISLWDLHKLGGLPISGHLYDEAFPNTKALNARNADGFRRIPRAYDYLFTAYCQLADGPGSKSGVRVAQWIQFWCKRDDIYEKPPSSKPRQADQPPSNRYNPSGKISNKLIDWTPEELAIFSDLKVPADAERKTTYLAAFLSCWLCTFVLPGEERLIRPSTFEVAVQMARGIVFSLAPVVLANIYHGLNKMVTAEKPSNSGSIFPAHYLYGWLAHYFGTHYSFSSTSSPLMVQYSGHRGAKYFRDIFAHRLIHEGSDFRASCLALLKSTREGIHDDGSLEATMTNYIISMRTCYLPLRSRTSFFLEPYHPTRFSRQFGFCQEIPKELPRDADDGRVAYETALKYLRVLLLTGSHAKMTLPGSTPHWKKLITSDFNQWWRVHTVSDLRKHVGFLLASVDYKGKSKADEVDPPVRSSHQKNLGKRPAPENDGDKEHPVNPKRHREKVDRKTQIFKDLFDDVPDFSDAPAHLSLEGDFNLAQEVPELIPETLLVDAGPSRVVHGKGKPAMHRAALEADSLSSCDGSQKKTSTGGRSSSSSSLHSLEVADDICNKAVGMMKRNLLQVLKDASYDDVENVAATASRIYEKIQSLGGDCSALQVSVDSYVQSVDQFLAARRVVPDDDGLHALDVSQVEATFRSARTSLQDALRVSEDQEAGMASLAKKIADTEAVLKKLQEDEKSLKVQHRHQLEVVSKAKSKVASLKQQLEDTKASKAQINQLQQAKTEMEKCKKALDTFI